MSDLVQPTGPDQSHIDRRSLLRNMGVGALGAVLGAGCGQTSVVPADDGSSDSSQETGVQPENCGTVLGTVLDPGGREGFGNAAINVLVPREPQQSLTGQLMTPDGAVALEIGLDEASLDSIVSQGVPDVEKQLEEGEGFQLEMEDGKQITAERLFRGSNGSIQFAGVRTSFAEPVLNVAGFGPPNLMMGSINDLGSSGQAGYDHFSEEQRRAIRRRKAMQGWEIALIFGVVVVITALACAWLQYQAARECDDVAVIEQEWTWYEGLTCTIECR